MKIKEFYRISEDYTAKDGIIYVVIPGTEVSFIEINHFMLDRDFDFIDRNRVTIDRIRHDWKSSGHDLIIYCSL